MGTAFRPAEPKDLHEKLSSEDRDELLHCLLVAPACGGRPTIKRPGERPLCCSTTKVLGERGDA